MDLGHLRIKPPQPSPPLDVDALLAEMNAIYDAIHPRRTVICHPDQADMVSAAVEQSGAQRVTVKPSSIMPEGQAYVIDEDAAEAALQEALRRPIRLY
ncbi:hypothetical protein [Catenuloplanes japonicus]|uniref:hypothetical protein n=1 Tax=Catenuloplanes japonicus TaxID=33876 RepID=UPI000A7801FD|nr:hypothetical protein [Catenuloplanes japonicus]